MSKRFTETTKWADPWYRGLTPKLKSFWQYCLDNCDHAGVWPVDFDLASFCIGEKVTKKEVLESFSTRVVFFGSDKMLVVKFISFQYGTLSPDCKMHRPVFASLSKNRLNYENLKGINTLSIGFDTLQDKDQDQKKDQEKEARENFEEFRKAFPGTKRGEVVEWSNFLKSAGKDWFSIAGMLKGALEKEKAHKAAQKAKTNFAPQWAHLQTWINQKRWTQEFGEIQEEKNGTNRGYRETRAEKLDRDASEFLAELRGDAERQANPAEHNPNILIGWAPKTGEG